MIMNDETYHLVKGLPKVSGFLGHVQGKPSPVPEAEINKILSDIEEGIAKPKPSITFDVGEQVRVCLLYTSPSPRDATLSRMPSSA